MIDFYDILEEVEEGQTINPFASKVDGEYSEGSTSIDYLNDNFGQYETAEEMINATPYEGYKLYFAWLRDKGILN